MVLDTSGTIAAFKQIDIDGLPLTLYNTSAERVFLHHQHLYMLGYYNNESEIGSRYYILPLTDTTISAAGVLIPYNDFALQKYLRPYTGAFPYSYYATSFKKDGSLAELTYKNGYSYFEQFDSLGRICPDYNLPQIDSQLIKRQFIVESYTNYNIISDSVCLHDKAVTVSTDNIIYNIICVGRPDINDNAQKESSIINSLKINNEFPRIFPNPVYNILHVTGLQKGSSNIIVYSSVGVVVKSIITTSINSDIVVSNLFKGVYFIKILQNNKQLFISSFVKE